MASSLSGSQFSQPSSLRRSDLNAGEGMMNVVSGSVAEEGLRGWGMGEVLWL